ncbi:hypothetical protein HDV04_000345 [Boothiomyces sp. JEL0838]|nr:hypothetical protein HDV04_000345 [Boothiomyces sp. JEL0838]
MDQPIEETIIPFVAPIDHKIESDIPENIVQEDPRLADMSNVVTANVNMETEIVEEIQRNSTTAGSINDSESPATTQIIDLSNAAVKHFSLPNLQNVTVTEEERPVLIDYIRPDFEQPEVTFKSQYIQQQSFISNPQLHYDEFSLNSEQNPAPNANTTVMSENIDSSIADRMKTVSLEPHHPVSAETIRYGSLGGKINLLGLLKEAEQITREKAQEIVNAREQETPHPTDTQSEMYEIQTVVTLSVIGNPATSTIGKEASRLPKWSKNLKINTPPPGPSLIPIVKNRTELIAKAMEKSKIKSKLDKFNKKAKLLRLVTNQTSTKNMLLTNKGLFSEVLIKNPKSDAEKNMKVWFREEQSQFAGFFLPQLESRPISRQVLSKYHKDHSADRPPDKNFSFYSQPLPRFRGPSFWPKEETDAGKRHKLLNEIKIQREIGTEVNESGFPVLTTSQNRRLKTAEVLSAIQVLDHIGPNRHHIHQLEKEKIVLPALEDIRLEEIKDTGFHMNSIHLEKRRVNSRATSRNPSRYSNRIQTASVRVPTSMVDYGNRLISKELEL